MLHPVSTARRARQAGRWRELSLEKGMRLVSTTPQHPPFFAGARDRQERLAGGHRCRRGVQPAGHVHRTNTIGTATLIGSWRDDQFDPEQHAFYYARVLEIPTPRTPRWTHLRRGGGTPRPQGCALGRHAPSPDLNQSGERVRRPRLSVSIAWLQVEAAQAGRAHAGSPWSTGGESAELAGVPRRHPRSWRDPARDRAAQSLSMSLSYHSIIPAFSK